MNNIAIITARSGSKGLKDKNIKNLCGKPLMAYSIEAAVESKAFDTVMVSTDSDEYAEIAREYGASVPFLRSEKNSTDTAGSWETINEVLEAYLLLGKRFDTVCLLQPTSPLRTSVDILNGYKIMAEKRADAVTAVCEMDHSPALYMVLPEDHSLNEYRERAGYYQPRQKQMYHRINGALYIRKIKYEAGRVFTKCDREYAYIMTKANSIDIDDQMDFYLAEYMKNNIVGLD